MPIAWDADTREWHLHNRSISHVLRELENGWLGQLHLGAPLAVGRSYRHLGPARFDGFADRVGDPIALVVPTPDSGDMRIPGLVVVGPDGSSVLDLRVTEHRILAAKPALDGLPSTYAEPGDGVDTLEVDLLDAVTGLRVTVSTSIFEVRPVVTRHLRLTNTGSFGLTIRCAMSASIDLPDARWDLTTLSGAWARERHPRTARLLPGRRGVGSVAGASGHEHNPFLLLTRPSATEAEGEALGVSLVYSGSFLAEVQTGAQGTARARIGIAPDGFTWALEPGASFTTPEAIIAWADTGVGGVSDALHGLCRDRLARGPWRDRPRPIVLNNWEATYFDFDEATLLEIARSAAELGIECFVLDDGWFGARDDDTTSLGDWTVDRRKLPGGLAALAAAVEGLGMRFGLWIEPEMVSERSELFAAHPDWAIGVPGRPRTPSRHQYMLDLGRPEVIDHLTTVLGDLLSTPGISYVKWDKNRSVTEPYSVALPPERQGEMLHRQVLGVYELYRRLTERFPDVLFESCSGGGGRFDPGLLAFAPQAWTSDDTDAIERLAIQWGTSLAYPLSAISAHVSAVPNHQVGRVTPLATRAAVAFFGVLGYELDPRRLTDEERREVAEQIAWYSARRELFQRGRFIRLRSPFDGDGNETAWSVVSVDRRHAIVGWYRTLQRPVPLRDRLRLRGMDPAVRYRVSTWRGDPEATVERGGDELASIGLSIEPPELPLPDDALGDFSARLFELRAV